MVNIPADIRAVALSLLLAFHGCSTDGGGPDTVDAHTDPAAADAYGDWLAKMRAQLDPARSPAGNFDLSHWKLTLPAANEIQAAELSAGYQKSQTFYTDPETGGMVFRCPNLAGTTQNSKYSRTELREMRAPDGPAYADANNWTMEGGGWLRSTLRVDRVSTSGDGKKTGRVIIGQIHAVDSEVIRLYYDKKPHESTGRIYAGMDDAGNHNSYSPDIVSNAGGQGIALGEIFSYDIRLEHTALSVLIQRQNGETASYLKSIDPDYAGENLYFKAGVYNQNNTGSADDYAQATFFELTAAHP